MLRRVHLVGAFAGFHDGPIEVHAATPWDAVEAVVSQIKGFLPDASTGRKVIQLLGFDTIEGLKSTTPEQDLYLAPALSFGKNGGTLQVIVGTVLIVVGFLMAGTGAGSAFGLQLILAGSMMVLGGVVQMLSPQPKLGGAGEAEVRSKYLSGIQNTVAIGTPIGLLYGRRRIGGQILSLNLDARKSSASSNSYLPTSPQVPFV